MRTPEKGGTTFGIDPRGFVSAAEAARQEARGASVAEPKPKRIKQGMDWRKRVGLVITAAGIALGIGKVIQEVTQNDVIPVTRSSENPSGNPSGDFEKKFPIALPPDSFAAVTPEEEQELWKNTQALDLENHTFTAGFPFDAETVRRNPNIRMDRQFDMGSSPSADDYKLKQAGVKNTNYYSGLGKGESFRLFYPDNVEVSVILVYQAGITQGESRDTSTPAYTLYRVTYRDKITGEITKKSIEGLYAESLISTNPLPKDHHQVFEDGVPIKSGEAIMKTTTDFKDLDGKNKTILTQKGQFVERTFYEQQSPMKPVPLTGESLSNPNGKIAISQTP